MFDLPEIPILDYVSSMAATKRQSPHRRPNHVVIVVRADLEEVPMETATSVTLDSGW
jgi:hypothetical protein